MDSPRVKYAKHRHNAAERGIEFDLTFDEWWAIWEPHFSRRGRTTAMPMQMCRTRDEGGYTLGNVRIATIKENAAERGVAQRVASAASFAQPRTSTAYGSAHWLNKRRDIFKPYVEEEEPDE